MQSSQVNENKLYIFFNVECGDFLWEFINCNFYNQAGLLVFSLLKCSHFREGSIIRLLTVFFSPVAQSELILKDEGRWRTQYLWSGGGPWWRPCGWRLRLRRNGPSFLHRPSLTCWPVWAWLHCCDTRMSALCRLLLKRLQRTQTKTSIDDFYLNNFIK